jgi:5,10-methylenetetrahydromethanopterin reductase
MSAVRTGVWFFPDAPAGVIVDTIVAAERLGIDEVWLGDEGPARDPFALLAAAARVTHRIKLGVGVTNPYLRHPAVTAASALTIHELSGGRMLLGIGPGGQIALGPAEVERVRPLSATRDALRIIRAVSRGERTRGYVPPPHALASADLPLYVGARGEAFNRLASELADGVFLGGIPRSRLAATVAWAHSVRRIDVALYASAAFDDAALERARPRMIYALLDAPDATRQQLGVRREDAVTAAHALAQGDDSPARRLIDDRLLDELVLHGPVDVVGRGLAERARALHPMGGGLAKRARSLHPTSIGFALLTTDPLAVLEPAAAALSVARQDLDRSSVTPSVTPGVTQELDRTSVTPSVTHAAKASREASHDGSKRHADAEPAI